MAPERKPNLLIAAGYAALGSGYLWEYFLRPYLESRGEAQRLANGGGPVAGLQDGSYREDKPKVLKSGKVVTVHSIEERVAYIRNNIIKGSLDIAVKEKVAEVLGRRKGSQWEVPEKDFMAEVVAIHNSLKDPRNSWALRYTRDHVAVDQFMSAKNLMRLNIGDCDDGTTLEGAMLRSVGYPLKMRLIQAKVAPSWSHIYLRAGLPPSKPTRWFPLDWSVNKPAGWEAPGAEDCFKSGKPSGVVEKVKDIDV